MIYQKQWAKKKHQIGAGLSERIFLVGYFDAVFLTQTILSASSVLLFSETKNGIVEEVVFHQPDDNAYYEAKMSQENGKLTQFGANMNQTRYPFEDKIEVTFRDIDAMGFVNNAVFFTYFETVRVKYVTRIFEQNEILDLDLPLILVEAKCTYHSPALLGETLAVGVGLSRFGYKSFDLLYRIEGEDGRLIATGHTIQVMYDYGLGSAFAIPVEIKERVQQYQKSWTP
jgi:acyl-CoA thioester hydrolase